MSQIELTGSQDSNTLKFKPPQLTGSAKWADIGDLINRWARRRPQRAYELELALRETRAGLTDKKFATMNNEAMAGGRHMLTLDPELINFIEAFYPKFFEDKENIHGFIKRFPKFAVPEKS